ncbi:MAG: DUF2017 family protein [Microbacterium sp.]|nr:DUF2017 family protein [Microbacterium sp.]
MTGRRVPVVIAPVEAVQLAHLLADFRELVHDGGDNGDPAVDRLAPRAYPDDDDASAQFRSATRGDLLSRRAADAAVVEATITPLRDAAEGMSDEEVFTERLIEIDEADVDAWLRTLTALRLVVATRLGIVDDGDERDDDPRARVYDWLGYRLETMVQAADDLDLD